MNLRYTRTLVAAAAVAALAFPAVSDAKGQHGHGKDSTKAHGQNHADAGKNQGKHQRGKKMRSLIVKGTVSAVGTDGTVQVTVNHANHHGSGLVGQTVTFDVSNARITVRDVNNDGNRDLADVAVGDRVQLQARVAKGENPDPTATIVARRLIDKGAKAADNGDQSAPSGDTTEPPSGDTTEPPTGDTTAPPSGDTTGSPSGDTTEPPPNP